MDTKQKVVISVVCLATAFAVGRWASPTKVKIQIQTVEVEKLVTSKDTKRTSVTTDITQPNGAKEHTVTTVDEVQVVKEKEHDTAKIESKEITRDSSKVTIAGVVFIKPFGIPTVPVYGLSAYKPILGPIGVGVQFLSDRSIGFSIGLSF